eukprot:c14213_g1_i1.p1 GENE.c14213_g1_i1~~c14213_g1_i1.p1  ORF type:complete len:214 (+),score=21.38 c14213_g1_i1:228-869(+)
MPSECYWSCTVVAVLKSMYPTETPAPCHRIDQGTSGLLVCARTTAARKSLGLQFQNHKLVKTYRAVVCGVPEPSKFTIDVPIGVPFPEYSDIFGACPHGNGRTYAVPPKPSISHCTVLRSSPCGTSSLVEVQIATGRPHQIRIHMAYVGHPLRGDPLYEVGGLPIMRQIVPLEDGGFREPLARDCGYELHAFRVEFQHPETNEVNNGDPNATS